MKLKRKKQTKIQNKIIKKFFKIKAKKIIAYCRFKYILWNMLVFLAIFSLGIISLNEALVYLKIFQPPKSLLYYKAQFYCELIAIGILTVDIANEFVRAKNKAVFVKKNWLMIFIILPAGIFSKALLAFRIFPSFLNTYLIEQTEFFLRLEKIYQGLEKLIQRSQFLRSFVGEILIFYNLIFEKLAELFKILKFLK